MCIVRHLRRKSHVGKGKVGVIIRSVLRGIRIAESHWRYVINSRARLRVKFRRRRWSRKSHEMCVTFLPVRRHICDRPSMATHKFELLLDDLVLQLQLLELIEL